jgi:hypothetical protein
VARIAPDGVFSDEVVQVAVKLGLSAALGQSGLEIPLIVKLTDPVGARAGAAGGLVALTVAVKITD